MQAIELRSQDELKEIGAEQPAATKQPAYTPPTMTSYTDEQLLEALGPARAGGYVAPN